MVLLAKFKKLKRLILFALCIITFGKAHAQTPVEMNDKLVSYVDTLSKLGTEWGNTFAEILKGDKKYTRLVPIRSKIEAYINRSLKTLKGAEDIGGSKELREAIITFLNAEMTIVQTHFKKFEKFTAATKNEDIAAETKKLEDAANEDGKQLENINKLQQEYAAKNGFTIQQPE